jgi:5-methylcytosine-specific restriction endonuclease McrA
MVRRMRPNLAALLTLVLGATAPVAGQKQCHKGISCGNTCISASKTCRIGIPSPSTRSASPRPLVSKPQSSVIEQPRDERGRFIRSRSARARFMRLTGHPGGWSGHVVDHIIPLACGGPDTPENMQWQTVEAAKAKDRVERRDCVH